MKDADRHGEAERAVVAESVASTSMVRAESWRVVIRVQCIWCRALRIAAVVGSTRHEREYDEGRSCCRSSFHGAP